MQRYFLLLFSLVRQFFSHNVVLRIRVGDIYNCCEEEQRFGISRCRMRSSWIYSHFYSTGYYKAFLQKKRLPCLYYRVNCFYL